MGILNMLLNTSDERSLQNAKIEENCE